LGLLYLAADLLALEQAVRREQTLGGAQKLVASRPSHIGIFFMMMVVTWDISILE
jgi:hypothetical protein